MPIVCIERKNRKLPRRFTPKDAARIVCAVIDNGYSEPDVRDAISDCLPQDDCEKEREFNKEIIKAAELAAALIAAVVPVARAARRAFAIIMVLLRRRFGSKEVDEFLTDMEKQVEKTQKILEDIVRRAREFEKEVANG